MEEWADVFERLEMVEVLVRTSWPGTFSAAEHDCASPPCNRGLTRSQEKFYDN